MNDHFFSVSYGFTAAASVMPYSGGNFVVCRRKEKILKSNKQLTKLLTKF